MTEAAEIPLYAQGRVVAHSLVDLQDFQRIGGHRWVMASGYASRHAEVDGRRVTVWMHREILGVDDPDLIVDHINRNPIDNRRSNLRVGTTALNNQNIPPGEFRGGSVYRGVVREGNRWRAFVRGNHLGSFFFEIDAGRAAEAYRREHMPWAEPDPRLADAEATGDWREAA